MGEPVVVQVPERNRWEVRVDSQLAGFTEYFVKDDRYVFVHTEIADDFGGRGIGSVLVRSVMDDIRSQGRMLVPLCPFVRGWIDKHPEHGDLVDRELLERFDSRHRDG
jgi:predicted GNAT family acetyltransferase